MSRIIVKNLPDSISATKLEQLFSTKGTITDLQLKYTKKGVFRKFAFVGFKSEEEANSAKEFFNNTYIKTSKIQVEFCKNLNDPSKPKSWKKLKEDRANKVEADKVHAEKKDQKKKQDKSKREENDEDIKNDPKFKEFLELRKSKTEKPIWAEEIPDLLESDEDDSEEELPTKTKGDAKPESLPKGTEKPDLVAEVAPPEKSPKKIYDDSFTVKISNLPYNCKRKQLKSFLRPLKIVSLRYPPQNKGFAFVKFKTKNDMQKALIKHKGFLDGHCVYVAQYCRKPESVPVSKAHNQTSDPQKNLELLAETGKIFVRNLCFSVKESELENIFKPFGPLAELHLPINSLTKQCQGIAFVTYVFAEHAVKAFTELDGTIFQGRVLHLLPCNPKKEFEIDENDMNYKKKKAMEMKSTSGNSLNWNILFVGTRAVADVISEKYNIDRSKLLSGDSKESVAVRLALAETQLVKENRDFLVKHGVQLDAFSQANAERSKTVIIVKHLPARTKSDELNKLFSNFGAINRIVVPPSGLAALVEFDNPTEAKAAFRKLAYSKFYDLPLYLEWAPMDCIKDPVDLPNIESEENEDQKTKTETEKPDENVEEPTSEDQIEDSEMGVTLFVRNISFETTDADFEKHFKKFDGVLSACVSRRMDPKRGSLSMGFGFVKYKSKQAAVQALNNLQHSMLDGYALELKFSNQSSKAPSNNVRKKYEVKKQTSSKILVRNIPFQASEKEVHELFIQFGQLNFVRLPKKLGGGGQHRGFGFVEYISKEDAKRAFNALCHSTHFYGRRLVLEWANAETENVDELRKRTAKNFAEDVPKKRFKKSKLIEDVELATARHNRED